MSDEGKSWYKVRDSGGLRIFVFAYGIDEALEIGGRAMLIAESVPEAVAIGFFKDMAKRGTPS